MIDLVIALLKQNIILTEERDMLLKKTDQTEQDYAFLLDQLQDMRRHRFGTKSERYIDTDNPQLSLLELLSVASLSDTEMRALEELKALDDAESESNQPSNVVNIKAKQQPKKKNVRFADHLPRKDVVITVKEHDKTCQCGCQKSVINHERHERLNYVPPVYEVIVERREVVACPKGCRGEMVTADKPKHILPKSK